MQWIIANEVNQGEEMSYETKTKRLKKGKVKLNDGMECWAIWSFLVGKQISAKLGNVSNIERFTWTVES